MAPAPGSPHEETAIQVDLSNESVRLPLYKEDAPKLANLAVGCPTWVQTVTIEPPTSAQNPFGAAVVDFQGAPDFSPA